MARALDVASVIAGEAVSGTDEERWNDMVNIASVISNRAALLGVPQQDVIANQNEFNAYGKSLPPGVNQDLVDMAQAAADYVAENGPVNNATFYATPAAAGNLPNGLNYETATTGHQYFSDPQSRAIGTANGYVSPNQYAFAQNLDEAGVPTPYAPDDLTNNSLLSAFSATPTYGEDPFSSILGGQPQTAFNGWQDMAAASPFTAPMGSVQASGILGGTPALEADATARPMLSVPAVADLGTTPGLDATTTAGILSNATPAERMGIAEPGFDASRFDGVAPQVASVDASRFSTPAKTDRIGILPGLTDTARMNPLTGAIDPATNTQSFLDQPAAPADLGNFPGAYSAQRGPTAGLLSADAMTVQGLAEKQLAENIASPSMPGLSVPAGGILAGNMPMEAQATVPSLASAYTAPAAVTPAEHAIANITTPSTPGILSGSPISTANAPLTSSVTSPSLAGKSILAAQPVQQNQFVSSFPTAVAQNQLEPATVDGVVAAPTLDTIQVPDQPAVASIDGPTTTSALDQQRAVTPANTMQAAKPQPTVQAAQNTKSFKDSLLSKETALGGILGGLALGPVGGILGAVAGQQVSQNGGLTGLLGGPTSFNNIGYGPAASYSVWGGAPVGTQATASDGQTVSALPGGLTAVTNSYGVTTAFDKTGKGYSVFGGVPGTTDTDQQAAV